MHINVLELKAAFIGIRTYCHNRSYKHIRVMSDSSTAIVYINNKGGIKSKKCNEIAKEIWLWCFNGENLTTIQNGNLIPRYLLKLLISSTTQKLISLLPE